jgi:hypothetical protein
VDLDSEVFSDLVHLIVLHLLASCYTALPTSSADNLPIYEQRTTPALITSLRLHSRYRYSPAAGHHARESSETASWPGLYAKPSIEDQLAEAVSHRRRLQKHMPSGSWCKLRTVHRNSLDAIYDDAERSSRDSGDIHSDSLRHPPRTTSFRSGCDAYT